MGVPSVVGTYRQRPLVHLGQVLVRDHHHAKVLFRAWLTVTDEGRKVAARARTKLQGRVQTVLVASITIATGTCFWRFLIRGMACLKRHKGKARHERILSLTHRERFLTVGPTASALPQIHSRRAGEHTWAQPKRHEDGAPLPNVPEPIHMHGRPSGDTRRSRHDCGSVRYRDARRWPSAGRLSRQLQQPERCQLPRRRRTNRTTIIYAFHILHDHMLQLHGHY